MASIEYEDEEHELKREKSGEPTFSVEKVIEAK